MVIPFLNMKNQDISLYDLPGTPYPIIDDGDGLTFDTTPAVFDNSFA